MCVFPANGATSSQQILIFWIISCIQYTLLNIKSMHYLHHSLRKLSLRSNGKIIGKTACGGFARGVRRSRGTRLKIVSTIVRDGGRSQSDTFEWVAGWIGWQNESSLCQGFFESSLFETNILSTVGRLEVSLIYRWEREPRIRRLFEQPHH